MARILIVDDHAALREELASILSAGGHEVRTAGDQGHALDLADAAPPDLVICDILMPGGDGYELVRALRRRPALSQVPFIFHTAAFHADEALCLARASGVTCVLTKPCAPETLRLAVAELLAGRAGAATGPTAAAAIPSPLRLISARGGEGDGEPDRNDGRQMALIEMCLELSGLREPDALVKSFSRWTRELVAARHAAVALWEPGTPSTAYVSVSGLSDEAAAVVEAGLTSTTPLPVPLSATGPQRRAGPVGEADAFGLPWAYPPVGAMVVVPVKSPTRSYGWVCATSRVGGTSFSLDDERLLAIFAAYLGRLFENHCLLNQLSQRTRQLELEVSKRAASQWRAEMQCAVAEALANARTIEEAAPEMLKAVCQRGDVGLAELWEVDEDRDRLEHVASWHGPIAGIEPFLEDTRAARFDGGASLPGRVIRGGVPVWIADIASDASLKRGPSALAAGLKSAMGFPVMVRGRMAGVLCLFGNLTRPPDADFISLFKTVGDQVGQFIDRRRQEARLMRLSRTHAVLTQASHLLGAERSRLGLLQRACRIAVEDGGYAGAEVFTLSPANEVVRAAAVGRPHESERPGLVEAVVRDVFRGGETPSELTRGFGQSGEEVSAALALAYGGRVQAVLVLHAAPPADLHGEEASVLRQMAADVSLALDALDRGLTGAA